MANVAAKLLFLDVLRIVAAFLVVFWHVIANLPDAFSSLKATFWIYNIIVINIGTIAVAVFFFVSGASLQYLHTNINSSNELFSFYIKRFARIYPTLWISVIIGLTIMRPDMNISINATKIILSLSGIFVYFRVPVLNPWCWFLGVLILFYLLFPALSHIMEKHPYLSITGIMAISATSRYLLNVYPMYTNSDEWGMIDFLSPSNFPLGNLFNFSLGIFIIRMGFYPRIVHNFKFLSFISALTYPIFLIHGFLMGPYTYPLDIPIFIFKLVFLSIVLYILDRDIQKVISRRKVGTCSIH
jgi:peptidoglycan/LPS O-acetylase OafA/YrhL